MASLHRDDAEVAFEEGMLCLPSHVLDEACDHSKNHHQRQKQQGYHRDPQFQYSKSIPWARSSSYQRSKHATGGPGMQAVFLVSGQGSCGTGVFLPQKAATKSTRKPACAPVLLPARVVQALNLKVHQLGLQISPSQGPKCSPRRGEEAYSGESEKKKNDEKDGMKQCSVISQSQSSSAEIFLPKEWTY
ncbi:uncharacterized protein LOC109817855 [Cajanus cajan]|uniref:Uncharacterized protein n=1 Tax=Cajanus cajan TaxID=3821 RepID=A0A151RKY4_CAJCA|nr:uncharacterized protein LOC109817855 [Cajanus cajan]KYP43209.1 hypothetical protein KK1_035350 [Cajanus cajan]